MGGCFDKLVMMLVGTRPARKTSWGRKFDSNLRALCKKASISRSWYILACEAKQDSESFFEAWVKDRKDFVASWEKSKSDWFNNMVCNAIRKGDNAIWGLLNRKYKNNFRPLDMGKGCILTDPALISEELSKYHESCWTQNKRQPPAKFESVVWNRDFLMK